MKMIAPKVIGKLDKHASLSKVWSCLHFLSPFLNVQKILQRLFEKTKNQQNLSRGVVILLGYSIIIDKSEKHIVKNTV